MMVYSTNYADAARRHWNDAQSLEEKNAFDCAGYHYGFAAECAVKCRIPTVIKRHFSTEPSRDLRTEAVKKLRGRRAQPLLRVLRRKNYLEGWDVEMRYAKTGAIDIGICRTWQGHAKLTLSAVEIMV